MLCPVCKFPNPKGSVYCHNCGHTFATFRQSSQWDRYSTSEDSGAYRYPTEKKTPEQASLFEEDADAMSTTQEIPRWDSIANAPMPAPPAPQQTDAGRQPPGAAMDYDSEQSIEEVSASYDNTFLKRFLSKLSPSDADLDSLSSTSRLPRWEEEDASISVSRRSSEPPPPPSTRAAPMPRAPVSQPPPPVSTQPPELIPVIEQPSSPSTDADLPSVQIADQGTGKYPTYPPPPPAAPPVRPAHPSGNRLAVVLICILAVILLLLGASAVLLYLIKTKPIGFGSDRTTAAHVEEKKPEPQAPAPSRPHTEKTRLPEKEKVPAKPAVVPESGHEAPKTAVAPEPAVEEPAPAPVPPPAKPVPLEVKNLNPLLNDPPLSRLVDGKIFSQGHVIDLGPGTFAIERPARVFPASHFKGKIPGNRALVEVEIAVTGSANPKQYKVFIIDARGEKRGPNSSVENYLVLPEVKNEVHKLWKKSCWVPDKETHLLHRAFLVPDNAASSFIIEIKGPKSGKVLWFKIAEQAAGD